MQFLLNYNTKSEIIQKHSADILTDFLKKIPESTLFNEAAQERIKLEKERKNDQWKKDLLVNLWYLLKIKIFFSRIMKIVLYT